VLDPLRVAGRRVEQVAPRVVLVSTVRDHQPSTRRLIGLDVVRAAAITGVVVAHVGGTALHAYGIDGAPLALVLQGGNGVELFFALSGFLIGGLLLEILEREPGVRAWLVFLVRRWLRTLPLYVVWVVVLLMTMPPPARLDHAVTYLSLTQNLAWPMASEWFGISWSLTIEEWFYVLFSGLLLAFAATMRRDSVLATCGIFVVLPLAARAVLPPSTVDWDSGMRKVVAFRLDAIAYGVAMAWCCRYRAVTMARWRRELFIVGLVMFVLAESRGFAGPVAGWWRALYFSLLPLSCSLMMPMAIGLRIRGRAARRVATWLSARSYALYLVHLTVLEIALKPWSAGHVPRGWLAPLVLVASGLLAEMSFRWLESPILARRPDQFVIEGALVDVTDSESRPISYERSGSS